MRKTWSTTSALILTTIMLGGCGDGGKTRALEDENANLKKQVDDKQKELVVIKRDHTEKTENLEKDLKQARQDLEAAQAALAAAKTSGEAETKLAEVQAELAGAKQQAQGCATELAAAREAAETAKKEADALAQRLAAADEKTRQAVAKAESLVQQLAKSGVPASTLQTANTLIAAAKAQTPPASAPAQPAPAAAAETPPPPANRLHTLAGHEGKVLAVAFSPDADTLATGSADNSIILWNVKTGESKARLTGHTDEVNTVAWSPDGRSLASGADFKDRTVKIWDMQVGQARHTIDAGGRVYCVGWSADGKMIAVATRDKRVSLYDPQDTRRLRELEGHSRSVYAVAFSPNSDLLASAGQDRTIVLWNPVTGEVQRRLVGHESDVGCLAFSPDGKTLASGGWDKAIRLWDVGTGEQKASYPAGANVRRVAFSPDGRLIARVGDDTRCELREVATGNVTQTLSGHMDRIFGLSFAPRGGLLATGSWDKTGTIWRLDQEQASVPATQPVAAK